MLLRKTIILIILCLFTSVSPISWANTDGNVPVLPDFNENQSLSNADVRYILSLNAMSDITIDKCLELVAKAAWTLETNEVPVSAMAFMSSVMINNVLPSLNEKEICDLLLDKSRTEFFKHFVIDSYVCSFYTKASIKAEQAGKALLSLLSNDELDERIKSLIISYCSTSMSDLQSLVNVMEKAQTEELIYLSLDRIALINPSLAEKKVLELYQSREKHSDEFLKGLFYLLGGISNALGEHSEAYALMYNEADRILCNAKENYLHDTVMLVLKDVKNIESLSLIAKYSDNYDNDFVYSIIANENLDILGEMLSSSDETLHHSALTLLSRVPTQEIPNLALYMKSNNLQINENAETTLAAIASSAKSPLYGKEGFAVYRDGVTLFELYNVFNEWHTGILIEDPGPSINSRIVYHSPGPSQSSQNGTWSQFLAGHSYKGDGCFAFANPNYYYYIIGKSVELGNIPYVSYPCNPQLTTKSSSYVTNYQIKPTDIATLRCDGLVEYVFEFYGFGLCVSGSYQDITKWQGNGLNISSHTFTNGVKPSMQYTKFPVH